jgi:5'-methylthioadenosine phosphorylase
MAKPTIGVIGGSGLYELDGLTDVREIEVETPFGAPSAPLVEGTLEGARMLFLPRHGKGHRFLPHEINYRANLFALKKAGADWVVAVSAVGSMKEAIAPGHIVIPDQFIDRTFRRETTFFGDGIAAHVGFGDPVCGALAGVLYNAAETVGATVHKGGAYLCMEGPQFSTRAESNTYRQWGVSIIGMTNATEAKLAREAELPYSTMALVTDYDCWHEGEEDVTVEFVIATLKKNVALARKCLVEVAKSIVSQPGLTSNVRNALKDAIMTAPDAISAEKKEALAPIIGRYIK